MADVLVASHILEPNLMFFYHNRLWLYSTTTFFYCIVFLLYCRDDSEGKDDDETGRQQLIYEQVYLVFVLLFVLVFNSDNVLLFPVRQSYINNILSTIKGSGRLV